MIGWLIVGIICLVILIFSIIALNTFANYDEWPTFTMFTSGIIIIVIIIFLICSPLGVKQEINTFNRYQELVDTVYNNGDITDTATNIKIIEMNEWLAGARAKEETYGIFSFYKGKLDGLEYITIDIGDQ